jgi:hypothetical protein
VIMLAAAAATWRKVNGHAGPAATEPSRPSCPSLRLAYGLAAGMLVGAMTGSSASAAAS